jgi:group I intron endonuclease
MVGIIYKARNKINNKEYIGQTIRTLYERRKQGYGDTKFGRAIKKYGKDNFEYTILYELESDDKAELICSLNILEEVEISIRNLTDRDTGYNTKMGGFNGTFKHTPEAIEKIREASLRPNKGQFKKGQVGTNLGKTWKNTEEYKKRHSEIMKKSYTSTGRKSGMYGKKQSEESRIKMSMSAIGKPKGRYPTHARWHIARNIINQNCEFCSV